MRPTHNEAHSHSATHGDFLAGFGGGDFRDRKWIQRLEGRESGMRGRESSKEGQGAIAAILFPTSSAKYGKLT